MYFDREYIENIIELRDLDSHLKYLLKISLAECAIFEQADLVPLIGVYGGNRFPRVFVTSKENLEGRFYQ